MIRKIIERLSKNQSFLGVYSSGVSHLYASGIVDFLREKAKCRFAPNLELHSTALEGARSAGYQEALEDIFEFADRYLTPTLGAEGTPKMEFGALDALIESGDLTKEEADAIRRDTPVDYSQYTREPVPGTNSGKHPETSSK